MGDSVNYSAAAYLVLRAERSKSNPDQIIGMRIVKAVQKYPALLQDEVALHLAVTVPAKAFEPLLSALIEVPEALVEEKIVLAKILG